MGVSPHVTTITLGRRSPERLDATYPHTPGAPSTCAYLVLLRVEIARFTRTKAARLCCSDPHLRVLRLVGGQPLAATLPYAVRTFLQCLVSQIAPAVVWRASPPDYQACGVLACRNARGKVGATVQQKDFSPMSTFTIHWIAAAVLSMASLMPAYALEPGDVVRLKAGAVLDLPATAGSAARALTIAHVHPVRSEEGVWYQILGTSADGQEQLVYADLSAKPPKVEVMVRRVALRKLVDRPRKFLDAVEDDEKGELTLDGVVYLSLIHI